MTAIHPRTRTLKLPRITIQLTDKNRQSVLCKRKRIFLLNYHSLAINRNSSDIVSCSLNHATFLEGTIAMVDPNQNFEKETCLYITSAIVKLDTENVSLGVINVLPHKVTVPKNTSKDRITILIAKQPNYFQPVDPALLTNYFPETDFSTSNHKMPNYSSTDKHWFPTPEYCSLPESSTGIHRLVYDEIVEMKTQ